MAGDLVDRLQSGDIRALARAITLVERGAPETREILRQTYPLTGRAYVVGITGPPGSGKSSLVSSLAQAYRRRNQRVGVIAVDPSSAFSGGAILGDRIRMQRHFQDSEVFIRSMATRKHPGGLSRATHDAVDLMDAAGFRVILLETVGVGQDEVEVVEGADTVCLVLVPGMGDDIQSIKAGVMEIAHIFVINKSDRDGADRVHADLSQMLSLDRWEGRWRPRITRTVAIRDEGIDALVQAIAAHRERESATDSLARRRKALSRTRFLGLLGDRLLAAVARRVGEERMEEAIEEIAERKRDPYTASQEILSLAGLQEE